MKSKEPTTKYEVPDRKGMTLREAKFRISILEKIIELYRTACPKDIEVYARALSDCVKAYIVAQGKMLTKSEMKRVEQIFLEEARKEINQ